jgi:hypothetical protein
MAKPTGGSAAHGVPYHSEKLRASMGWFTSHRPWEIVKGLSIEDLLSGSRNFLLPLAGCRPLKAVARLSFGAAPDLERWAG